MAVGCQPVNIVSRQLPEVDDPVGLVAIVTSVFDAATVVDPDSDVGPTQN